MLDVHSQQSSLEMMREEEEEEERNRKYIDEMKTFLSHLPIQLDDADALVDIFFDHSPLSFHFMEFTEKGLEQLYTHTLFLLVLLFSYRKP